MWKKKTIKKIDYINFEHEGKILIHVIIFSKGMYKYFHLNQRYLSILFSILIFEIDWERTHNLQLRIIITISYW